MSLRTCDVAVIGAGAAGFMCAIEAAKRGRRVLLLEGNDRVGLKIAISGGGRCNFTNLGATWEQYRSENPAFCKSALARYTPWDFVALVERHGIAYHEKKLGQQFCDTSSREIIQLLIAEAAEARVETLTSCRVTQVEKADRFRLQTSQGPVEAQSVVVASGGLSFPKLGANDFGHRLARQFGLRVTDLRPGLVPLTLLRPELDLASALSGVSLPVVTSAGGEQFEENLLFTHRGLSGPAILQISSYWKPGEPVRIDLMPGRAAATLLQQTRQQNGDLASLLQQHWPRRFAEAWLERHPTRARLPQLQRTELEALAEALQHWDIRPNGTEGYAKAEVTLGGVDTAELSSKTMEARKAPGLFFIGEVVDVTGWLGGYNFQWAWSSGFAAGQAT